MCVCVRARALSMVLNCGGKKRRNNLKIQSEDFMCVMKYLLV